MPLLICAWSCTARRLVKLDLHDNPLTPEVAKDLALALEGQDALEELNLNDTSLGDEGIRILAEALARNAPRLHTLELALNEVCPHMIDPVGGHGRQECTG
jgi:Ran GTPase-activating protein (RanGAP) involved in mRNA processing and transport